MLSVNGSQLYKRRLQGLVAETLLSLQLFCVGESNENAANESWGIAAEKCLH